MTKPRVTGLLSTRTDTLETRRIWEVTFRDTCGCMDAMHLPTWRSAMNFALHLANGGSRWEFAG